MFPEPPPNAARTVSYPCYVHEILAHLGVCYSSVEIEAIPDALADLRILLTVGETVLPDDLGDRLETWIRKGGAWLSVGGTCGLPKLFGIEVELPTYSSWGGGVGMLGEGYLHPLTRQHPTLQHVAIPLHCFNGISVRANGGKAPAGVLDAHGRPSERAAVVESEIERGRCFLIAPDITGAVVRIQQGVAITRDGIPAPDGTAPISDGVLKSGDGGALDWLLDREPVAGAPGLSAFLQPIADQWRELLIRAILHLAHQQGVLVPLLWLYPRNLPAIGHLSHDSDGNDPAQAEKLLAVLRQADVRGTWCLLWPSYPSETVEEIRAAGHELAMHFDAMSEGTDWSQAEFDRQYRNLSAVIGESPVTNKNHYLRWEGDTEFFEWCARRGVKLDESKGASKTGEAGFNFGTCHPYFPVDSRGNILDVLELPTPTQDLTVFAPKELADPLLAAALRHHGVLHLLFHPAHIEKPGVAEVLLEVVARAREQGMEWWTARQIADWERARRKVIWSRYRVTDDGAAVSLCASEGLAGATLLWPHLPAGTASVNGAVSESKVVTRWGTRFRSLVIDLEKDREYTFEIAGLGAKR